jgi:uncharacterized membrane protein (DUF2068 family)
MSRPTGVTILSILDFLFGVLALLGGILFMVGGGFIANMMNQNQANGAGAGAGLMVGLGAAFGVVFIIIGLLYLLIGVGMWKVKNWARILTIVFCGLGALSQAWGLVHHFSIFAIVILAIDILIIWYLLKPNVKAAFA